MITLIEAILAINPTAQVSITDENWDTIIWHNIEPLEKSVVLAKKVELETAYNDNTYQRDRAAEYKELKEQLDLLYHDMTAGKLDNTGKWHKHIKSVKDKYPKG